MNALAVRFSGWAIAALAFAGGAQAQGPVGGRAAPDGQIAPAAAAAIAASHAPASEPSLSSVPPLPKDVRQAPAWKSAVLATKGEGAALMREAAAEPWTLHDTEAWAARERAEAAPPPAITTPSEADTEAFAAAMRARAMPPPRKR